MLVRKYSLEYGTVLINISANAVAQKFVCEKFLAKDFFVIIRSILSKYDH